VPELAELLKPQARVRVLKAGDPDPEGRCVVYWMQRAQRGLDNPALEHAIAIGNALKRPVVAVFGLTEHYPGAEARHYQFLIEGLIDARDALESKGVPLVVRIGPPNEVVAGLVREVRPALVVGDENPVKVGQHWRHKLAEETEVPIRLVDADVVVPSGLFPKEEYAARTLRLKMHRIWEPFFEPQKNTKAKVPYPKGSIPSGESLADPAALLVRLKSRGVAPVIGYKGGTVEALSRLKRFVKDRLPVYATARNEPTPYMTSELSAHLHYGHIGPHTMALAARNSGAPEADKAAFLEELVVRRELAINFVWRNPDYDRYQGCPAWALKTLAKHAADPRPFGYTREQMEAGETGDPLWNAAQKEMVYTGRMHNYLRMYWGKKILEWCPDPEGAFDFCLEMNNRWFLCGRDPNGYAGVAWAIGGKHDRPWGERPIYGMVRSMSYQSTRKKFDSDGYIARVRDIEKGLRKVES